jgi:hypothetical protein
MDASNPPEPPPSDTHDSSEPPADVPDHPEPPKKTGGAVKKRKRSISLTPEPPSLVLGLWRFY